MRDQKNWQCPYCGCHQVLSIGQNIKRREEFDGIVKTSKHGDIGFQTISISCLNQRCRELSFKICIRPIKRSIATATLYFLPQIIKSWDLLPDSIAKPQPDYIPEAVRKDYEEACKIAKLSPNASAVLARRCLQGMIRDFCEIKENTLYAEIEKLKAYVAERKIQRVTEESIQAIDSIRKMGNIGAHMSQPTGTLIDVEENEASLLIQLIETLFKDWYVAQHEREARLKSVKEAVAGKNQAEKSSPARPKGASEADHASLQAP